MKERPILFTGAMVRALLAGDKTQTRRIMKPQPHLDERGLLWWNWKTNNGSASRNVGEPSEYWLEKCPYGQIEDQLWVRETFQPLFAKGFDHGHEDMRPNWETGEGYAVTYPATDEIVEWVDGDDNITSRSKPSIHMPRWASRILLEITAVRVERLQSISRGDAMDEGCPFPNMAQGDDPRKWYADLWESINGAGSWAANPWVWVVDFRRITK